MKREVALRALRALHDEVDREAGRLAVLHAARLRCGRGCADCCLDDLSVTAIEAERIRSAHATLLRDGEPHAPGRCAFLDGEGGCRIYADRPLVCRTQGLPLRVIYESADEELVERRDICPLNLDGGPSLESLDEDALWLVGAHELRLAQIDADFASGSQDPDSGRVPLRSLFAKSHARK